MAAITNRIKHETGSVLCLVCKARYECISLRVKKLRGELGDGARL